jgi:hypothetical protein
MNLQTQLRRRNKRTEVICRIRLLRRKAHHSVLLVNSVDAPAPTPLSWCADFQLATERAGTLLAFQNLAHWPL